LLAECREASQGAHRKRRRTVVRQVVYRKEVVVMAGAIRKRKAKVLAPKSVARFDVSASRV